MDSFLSRSRTCSYRGKPRSIPVSVRRMREKNGVTFDLRYRAGWSGFFTRVELVDKEPTFDGARINSCVEDCF